MKQYHDHLKAILENGTKKSAAREGMPGSISLFGYQNRYNLQKGFPILTTKHINFKNIVTELLWFLKGDTNIKYLVDNGCNIWNEDAYNYYCKICSNHNKTPFTFEEFITFVKQGTDSSIKFSDINTPYKLGDCGKQYGWLWRNWEEFDKGNYAIEEQGYVYYSRSIDQIKNLIEGLKSNPEGRRHIITAWNPTTLDDMALNACHSFVQFNCRKRTYYNFDNELSEYDLRPSEVNNKVKELGLSLYYLDCQLYQRSADMFLGVPYNIASYALLTEIIAKICNMIPGEFIHTFGDSHIYDNHEEQVKELLDRDAEKYQLPKLEFDGEFEKILNENWYGDNVSRLINEFKITDFKLNNYQSYPTIKAKLSTGLK